MAQKCIKWSSTTCLPCTNQTPAEVILCVPSSKLLDDTLHTLPAILTEATATCNKNCGQFFNYTFCYDDALLADGATLLGADVSGVFCKDCFTTWVEDTAASSDHLADSYFGDGHDGDQTYPVSPFTADRYYNNFTIPFGQTFDITNTVFDKWMFFVKETLTINGSLVVNMPAGGDAVGSTGGTGFAQAGANGGPGPGAQPVFQAAANPSNGGSAGNSGQGGDGAGNPGGTNFSGAVSDFEDLRVVSPRLLSFVTNRAQDGQAGSAGGGDGVDSGGGGGAGGLGAVPIVVIARHIVIGPQGIIRGTGGKGGNGGSPGVGNVGGGGGAGGGGGSFIFLVYKSISIAPGGIIESVGGLRGEWGNGSGTGTNGFPGLEGLPGLILKFNLSTGLYE